MAQADSSGVEMLRLANAKQLARKILECLELSPWAEWPKVVSRIEKAEPWRIVPALKLIEEDESQPELIRGLAMFYLESRAANL